MKKKERVLIRFRPEIYECFELEAAYEGLRVGTIANRLLNSEIKKVARVGKGHCVVSGSEEDMAIPEGKKQDYYVLPASRDAPAPPPAPPPLIRTASYHHSVTEESQSISRSHFT